MPHEYAMTETGSGYSIYDKLDDEHIIGYIDENIHISFEYIDDHKLKLK